jgi:hypothetical protein
MARETNINPQKFIVLDTTGIVPTVPNPSTLRKYHANFLDTDLEIGEFARNIVDKKLWYRSLTGIIELPYSESPNNISDADAADLTDGGETTLHTHPGGAGLTHVQIMSRISIGF